MNRSPLAFFVGFLALILTPACGDPPCYAGDKSCEQQMMAAPPAGNPPPGNNVQPDMGGGNNGGTLNCNAAEELVYTCWDFQPPYATASFPGPNPTWTQLTNLRADPQNPKCVKYCAPKVGGFACIDKHTREIGNRPGQTVVDGEIGWCGPNAGCKPAYHIVGGRQQAAREYLGKCGYPVQIVDGWQVPVGTLSVGHGTIPYYPAGGDVVAE